MEQKLHKLSFFELQKNLFLDKNQIQNTFGWAEIDSSLFPDYNLTELEEELPKDLRPELVNLLQQKGQEMETN